MGVPLEPHIPLFLKICETNAPLGIEITNFKLYTFYLFKKYHVIIYSSVFSISLVENLKRFFFFTVIFQIYRGETGKSFVNYLLQFATASQSEYNDMMTYAKRAKTGRTLLISGSSFSVFLSVERRKARMKHASLFFEIVAIMSCFYRKNPYEKKKEYVFFTFDSAKTPKRVGNLSF